MIFSLLCTSVNTHVFLYLAIFTCLYRVNLRVAEVNQESDRPQETKNGPKVPFSMGGGQLMIHQSPCRLVIQNPDISTQTTMMQETDFSTYIVYSRYLELAYLE